MHSAGIVLMRTDPRMVADAIDLSRRTWRTIRQNLAWAFAYNVIGIPLAVAGWLNPVLAGAAMAASSVCVVANALLLRRWQPPAFTKTIDNYQGESSMFQFTVDGMSCAHCTGRVTKAVQAIDQGATVAIDLATKRVTMDSSANQEVLADAIDAAGYPVLARS